MDTFYRGNGQVALASGQVAQNFPERWLSQTGMVAHFSPDYPIKQNPVQLQQQLQLFLDDFSPVFKDA